MKSEEEIQEQIEYTAEKIEEAEGEHLIHTLGQWLALKWVLNEAVIEGQS